MWVTTLFHDDSKIKIPFGVKVSENRPKITEADVDGPIFPTKSNLTRQNKIKIINRTIVDKRLRDRFFLNYGSVFLSAATASTSVWFLQFLRREFRAFYVAPKTNYFIMLLCWPAFSAVTHFWKIRTKIYLQDPTLCEYCNLLKSGAVQAVTGAVLPFSMALGLTIYTAGKFSTISPDLLGLDVKNSAKWWNKLKVPCKNVMRNGILLNFAIGAFVAYGTERQLQNASRHFLKEQIRTKMLPQ